MRDKRVLTATELWRRKLLISWACFNFQSDDPAVKWQLNLYKDVLRNEEPSNPEKTVERVQRISAAVFHLEQVRTICSEECGQHSSPPQIAVRYGYPCVTRKARSRDCHPQGPPWCLTVAGPLFAFSSQSFANSCH
jgi:hypothetical protein